jgi:hypothetical protein
MAISVESVEPPYTRRSANYISNIVYKLTVSNMAAVYNFRILSKVAYTDLLLS